ncbi:MAG: DUF3553 domain-containing protein [Deltaproteobacteria bacterium]|nr:DUF3553 domain-containing protein [Candidatus Zymogenaceae bacterium]
MEYKEGDIVKHPTKEDWGREKVLADSDGDTVHVFFEWVGEKKLKLKYVQPIVVEGPGPFITPPPPRPPKRKYQSILQSIQLFLQQFPQGFYGKKFQEEEREYKDEARLLAQKLLEKGEYSLLLKDQDYEEIVKRALKIVNATNLIFPNEKMSLRDGLENFDAKKEFSEVLYLLLYDEGELEGRFNRFARMLEKINAAKWTTATYFPFIMFPENYMFVKPTVVKYASEACRREINYKSELNWHTYESVLKFSDYLFSEISELKPRDMIDVQTFMWCIAQ